MAGFFKDNPPATQVGSEDATESTIQEDAVTQTDTSGGFYQGSPDQTTTDAYTADALVSKNAAEAAKVAAEAAQAASETAKTAAETAETNAETAETNAETAETNAAASESAAAASATSASGSAATATAKASEAATSASNAATSATSAETAKTAAELAETNAESAETNAASSAASASTSASNASTSATAASGSASAASTSETNAATSATNAATSETNAATSASNASTSETNAAASATSASGSASTATTKASEASTSASNASASETAASNSASAASTSATAAAASETAAGTSETNAAASETNAAASATNAATSATNAATSASNASTSESNAATSATNAASSASAASTSETNAASSESNASTSATSAASSATSATAAKDAALAALDSFDDRYLGSKSSAPTLDNDGNALVSGALYFDSTSNAMKVYDGSQWLNAYASLSGALIANQNLSDLTNAATARTNLGLGTAATTASSDYATAAQADQTVTLSGGAGITTSGTYPNFTVTNSSPDQTVSLTGSGATSVSGTYPNFTISSTDTNTDTNTEYTAGSGITLTGTVFSNSAPDQTVSLTGSGATSVSGTYPNFTITSTDTNTEYTAGSGITLTGTVFSNSAPDQTVALTGAGGTTVSGTYPNFTISSAASIDGTTINPSAVQIGGTTVIDSSRDLAVSTASIGGATNSFALNVYHPTTNVVARFESGDGNVWIDLHDSNSGTYGALLGHDSTNLFKVGDSSAAIKMNLSNAGLLDTDAGYSVGSTTVIDSNRTVTGKRIQMLNTSNEGVAISNDGSGTTTTVGHTASNSEGIFWHTNTTDYGIFRGAGTWASPDYRQLQIRWDTGIELDGGTQYGKSGVNVVNGNFKIGGTTVIDSSRNIISPTVYINDANTIISEGSGNAVRITTNSGYVDIGPMNTTWSHFQTDRGKFYFDKSAHFSGQIYNYVSGTTSDPYWRAGNDGSGSGLDADLLDGQQGSYYNHRAYTSTSNYLGGHYVSGGSEKPNSSALGAGKMKLLMLSGSNVGVSSSWNDVLWMSSYSGGDVKRSTALISSKYDTTSLSINKVNYDSASWGTSYLFWNSGNDGAGSGLDADSVDGIHANGFLRSDATDYITGTLFARADIRNENAYRDHGVYGDYDSYKTNHIWSMGSSYRNHSSGSNFGNLYGASYTYSNRVYTSNVLANGHQMVWCQNGTPTSAMGNGLWTSGNVTAYSDIRVKTNLEIIPNALEKVQKLNGYTFDRTDVTLDQEGNPTIPIRQTGVVAQEVLEVLPEAVTGDEDSHYNVAYGNMVGLLIEAIKELQSEVDGLKQQLEKKK